MTRPCKSKDDAGSNPEIRMHACADEHSTSTLCGLAVEPSSVDVVAGYTSVCAECFPRTPGVARAEGDPIENRGARSSPTPSA
jgi:hypothetical protein